ncbi:MAG: DUF4396 domain-containing protein [Gammaproteobacteria bacterium]|nr:DUF4396 domain-containing protein [Gammaproteobacteria bacterium]
MEIMHHHTHERNSNLVALKATLHCLSGCSMGEITGMMVGAGLDLSNSTTIALGIVLAFTFGFLLTMLPLVRAAVPMAQALKLALASDTLSITLMEVVDNTVMLFIPGAMDAGLGDGLFWGSLFFSLVIAGLAAFPLVRWLISKGRGHAVVHRFHHHDGDKVNSEHAGHGHPP